MAPRLAAAFVITAFASIGLPGLNGFVGEFLVLLGSFGRFPVAVGIATTGVVFSAAYLLWARAAGRSSTRSTIRRTRR